MVAVTLADAVQRRGVWFPLADILWIGQVLPELMPSRQTQKAAAADADLPAPGAPESITSDMLDECASMGLG